MARLNRFTFTAFRNGKEQCSIDAPIKDMEWGVGMINSCLDVDEVVMRYYTDDREETKEKLNNEHLYE